MIDESDEEILKIIKARFPRTFEMGPSEDVEDDFVETRGRKSAQWHDLAIEYAIKRETEGVSRNEACREFKKKLEENLNYHVTLKTIFDVVRSHCGRPDRYVALPKFEMAVLENDEVNCVYWFKKLTPNERAKWGFE